MLRIMGENGSHAAEPKAFAAQASDVLLEVRTAVGQMLEACGVPVQVVQRSHRRLGIDKMLAWRLAKVLQADDPFATARHMPGTAAMRALFERAEAEEVAPEVIERAQRSIERLESFMQEHAESRRAFDLMVSAHADQGQEETDLVHRKEATRAQSYIWGVFARVNLRTYLCRPNGAGAIDVATVGGFVDLQWIRPNVGWTISWRGRHDDSGAEFPIGEHRPLDPDLGPDDVPLLKKYSSSSFPPMRRFVGLRGTVIDEVVQSNVGRSTSTTCMMGEINPGWMPQYAEGEIDSSSYNAGAHTPAELFVFDYLAHRDMQITSTPRLRIYGDMERNADMMPAAARERHRIMPWMELEDLGPGIKRAYLPQYTAYVDMLADCLDRLGWNPAEFRLYRALIEHPVLPSTVSLQYTLPPKPAT